MSFFRISGTFAKSFYFNLRIQRSDGSTPYYDAWLLRRKKVGENRKRPETGDWLMEANELAKNSQMGVFFIFYEGGSLRVRVMNRVWKLCANKWLTKLAKTRKNSQLHKKKCASSIAHHPS